MIAFARTRLGAFGDDTRGGVAVLFALSLFVVIMMLALAIDIARVVHTKSRVAAALDAAVLAAAKSLHDRNLSTAELTALARRYFDVNLGPSEHTPFGTIGDFNVNVDRATSTISIVTTANVATVFAKLAGITNVSLPTTAAASFNPKDIELSLSLDVTGSMCNPCTKISDLQSAASDMIDIMLSAAKGASKVRVALAPFAAGVNAGAYAQPATNRRIGDSCTFERDGSSQATDDAPGAGSYLKVAGDSGVSAALNNCPSGAEIMALSDDARALKSEIGQLRAGGSTAGHLGTAWAWYLVSPKWASVWPAGSEPVAYGDKKTIKAVVLMTDGVYNTFGGACDRNCSNVSAQASRSQDVAKQLCSNMKDLNVLVYSVGFRLDDALAEAVLRQCATSATTFYRAENGDQLRTAFRLIAQDIMRLRLSQ